jgi:hypothetical protein
MQLQVLQLAAGKVGEIKRLWNHYHWGIMNDTALRQPV